MLSNIVLPIKKVASLVNSKISVEIKDENLVCEGILVAVDDYLNLYLEDSIEIRNDVRKEIGNVVIRGSNILTIHPIN